MKTEDLTLRVIKAAEYLDPEFFDKESSIAYPEDLGFWGLESNKIDELKRHLRKLKVELKGAYITKDEFPALVKKYPPSRQEIVENKDLERKGEELIESSLLEIELKTTVEDEPKVTKILKAIRAFPLEEHHITNLKKKHLEELEEKFDEQAAIDPYSAVLIAHTKSNSGDHVDNCNKAAKSIRDFYEDFKGDKSRFAVSDLDVILKRHNLQLRSIGDSSLKNLYDNLMKTEHTAHYNTGYSGADTPDSEDDEKVKDLSKEEKSEDIGIKGIASQILASFEKKV
jgi:hypothetical protein